VLVIEILGSVFVAGLAVGTLAMAFLALLGLLGGLRLVRCDLCGRSRVSAAGAPTVSCASCRHPLLLHPAHLWRHGHLRH
jgi:hypothetical protein